jgi:iron complex transport system ATP-binding protein
VTEVVACTGVSVRRGTRLLLDSVTWNVGSDERWVVMGPNGAGKTTLMQIIATRMFPTTGEVRILGEQLGSFDLAELRPLVGWASSALANDIPPAESVADVVLTGAWAVTGRWRERYESVDDERTSRLLTAWGIDQLANRTFGTLSEGERKRTLIARALMSNPELLILDEPGAGLDLGGREDLVERLRLLAVDPRSPAQVLVTHHVEEIPAGFTHALLLREGRIVAQGPFDTTMTEAHLSECFGLPIRLTRIGDRLAAQRSA